MGLSSTDRILELVEGPEESQGKYLDRDSLGAGEEAELAAEIH